MPKKKSFENTLNELETIIKELESGSPTLDQMIQLFEDGMKLMGVCQEHLNEVDERISTLINNQGRFIEKNGIDQS